MARTTKLNKKLILFIIILIDALILFVSRLVRYYFQFKSIMDVIIIITVLILIALYLVEYYFDEYYFDVTDDGEKAVLFLSTIATLIGIPIALTQKVTLNGFYLFLSLIFIVYALSNNK